MEKQLIINPYIHEEANLKKEVFLERIRNIRFLRKKRLMVLLFMPTEAIEWNYLEILYNAVNKGHLSPIAGVSKVFTLDLSEELINWFGNNTLDTIQKQVINCIASTYFNSNSIERRNLDDYVYSPVLEEAKKVIEIYYHDKEKNSIASQFKEARQAWRCDKNNQEKYQNYVMLRNKFNEDDLPDAYDTYKNASLKYINCLPPRFLPPIISNGGDEVWFNYWCFTESDWDRIVVRNAKKLYEKIKKSEGENYPIRERTTIDDVKKQIRYAASDDLSRAESDKELFEKWHYSYTNFEKTKQHFYSLFSKESSNKGFVYLIRSGSSDKVKVGWTGTEAGVESRLKSMQTGNPEQLAILGYFKVSSSKTEKIIHSYFEEKHITGEWFELSDEDCENILSDDWRIDNNIF